MINKDEVIEFFDACASGWDSNMIRNEDIISKILDGAGVRQGIKLLDVACGTGVLIPDYLKRDVREITAIDISPNMIKIAESKFVQDNVHFICGDIMTYDTDSDYDVVMIYNAFPHFPQQEKLVELLSLRLKKGGRLTVAHGMSREWIDRHHRGPADKVSVGLMEADRLADIFSRYMKVVNVVSDDKMYQVTGEV